MKMRSVMCALWEKNRFMITFLCANVICAVYIVCYRAMYEICILKYKLYICTICKARLL
jgi:hypothetical protein